MSAVASFAGASRGRLHGHAIVRLADEGVPIAAIARAMKMPFAETARLIQEAKEDGQIVSMPVREWPHGQVRYVPGNEASSERSPGPRPINLDEAREAIPFAFQLTACEAETLAGLMTRELATKNWLHGILYGHDRDGGAGPKIVDVFVCKLRKKLRPFGIEITTVWGRGYRLSPQQRDRVIALKVGEQVAA